LSARALLKAMFPDIPFPIDSRMFSGRALSPKWSNEAENSPRMGLVFPSRTSRPEAFPRSTRQCVSV